MNIRRIIMWSSGILIVVIIVILIMNMNSNKNAEIKAATINFQTNGGLHIPSMEYDMKKHTISDLPIPKKEGYTFIKWMLNVVLTKEFTGEELPSHNFNLYALYEINKYQVTLVEKTTKVIELEHGTLITRNLDPVKEGHEFLGWYVDQTMLVPYDMNKPVTSNITLYAKYKTLQYTITYKTNNGTTDHTQNYLYDSTISLYNPTYTGHKFVGWYISSSLLTKFEEEKMPANNLVLYAKWAKSYNLTIIVDNTHYNFIFYEGEIFNKDDFEIPGYIVLGYYYDEQFHDAFSSSQILPSENLVLYLKYYEQS